MPSYEEIFDYERRVAEIEEIIALPVRGVTTSFRPVPDRPVKPVAKSRFYKIDGNES